MPAPDPGPEAARHDAAGAEILRPHPTRDTFDAAMRQLKDEVVRMGSHVEEAIRAALDALARRDAEAALGVIRADLRINEAQRRIGELVIRTIAMQQPVARDLRYLLTLDHVAYELERMGDHAAGVAKQARSLAPEPSLPRLDDLEAIGALVARQVHDVLRALVDVDQAEAREVAARDDEIDHRHRRLLDDLMALMRADPANVEPGAHVVFAAMALERVGDRVTNVAEDVVFLATGQVEDLNP